MGQLTITFAGIMTHFYDCIPVASVAANIPMRTVLPDTLGINMGVVKREQNETRSNQPLEIGYYLMPHVTVISDVSNIVDGSNYIPLLGAHMQLANEVTAAFVPPPFDDGYHLKDYVSDLKISWDVVQNGNANGYFDIFSGTASVLGIKNDPASPLKTQVIIETDGTPLLNIKPFMGSPMNLSKHPFLNADGQWPLPNGELWVTNHDFDSGTEDVPIEFLLNYLVAEGGLPRVLAKNIPGMTDELSPLTLALLGKRLKDLGEMVETYHPPTNPTAPAVLTRESLALSGIARRVDLDQSCSDSRFP